MQQAARRLAAILALLVALTAGAIAQSSSTTVYVTRTGEKYHRASCRYLSRSQIPMALGEASKRFGPCSVCKPPMLLVKTPLVPDAPARDAAKASRTAPTTQCQATTKKGTQCSRRAKPGSRYCWQHG
jgi:hypothetical protein